MKPTGTGLVEQPTEDDLLWLDPRRQPSAEQRRQGQGRPPRSEIVKRLAEHPETALALVSNLEREGDRARAIDEVIGAVGDDRKSTTLLGEHTTVEQRVEALSTWGDRPSSLHGVATIDDLRSFIEREMQGNGGEQVDYDHVAAVVFGLSFQLHDRSDWDKILELRIGGREDAEEPDSEEARGGHTLRDILIWTVGLVHPVSSEGDDESDDDPETRLSDRKDRHTIWERVGLDADEAEERLGELENEDIFALTLDDIREAQRILALQRQEAGLPEESGGGGEYV